MGDERKTERFVWRGRLRNPAWWACALAIVATGVSGTIAWRRVEERGLGRKEMLRQIGVAFKTYASNAKGERYPAVTMIGGCFLPAPGTIDAILGSNPEGEALRRYMACETGIQLCYPGYLLTHEGCGIAFLRQYLKRGPEFGTENIPLGDEKMAISPWKALPMLYRLCEGVERFIATDISAPCGQGCDRLPILWEMPDPPRRRGGWVLYMDGHCEWKAYPGEFPMTKAFIDAIHEVLAPGAELHAPEQGVSPGAGPKGVPSPGFAPAVDVGRTR